MRTDRIHRTDTDDGVEIAGRVYGNGPPLVLVHGALDDGELDWNGLVPLLRDRYTCYVMSTRGRGSSSDGPDHSLYRLVQDVKTFIDSIGERVGVVGISGGGMLSLGASARAANVSAVAVYEPVVFEVMSEGVHKRFEDVIGSMAEAVEQGRAIDASRTFFEFVCNDAEFAALAASDTFERAAGHVPVDLQEFQQAPQSAGPSPTERSTLEAVAAPALVLHGSRTALDWFTESTRHVARHVPEASIRELSGAGHLGPIMEPQRVADEVIPFLESALEPA